MDWEELFNKVLATVNLNFFRRNDHQRVSAGAASAAKPIMLNSSGVIDVSFITSAATVEYIQDSAFNGVLTDSATIDFTYTDASNQVTAIVIDDSISNAKLRN